MDDALVPGRDWNMGSSTALRWLPTGDPNLEATELGLPGPVTDLRFKARQVRLSSSVIDVVATSPYDADDVEWDPKKKGISPRKHGLSFEEAVKVFNTDQEALRLYDEEHSHFEDRFIAIGPIQGGLVLVVWTEKLDGVIRVISARWATPREQRMYRLHMEHQR